MSDNALKISPPTRCRRRAHWSPRKLLLPFRTNLASMNFPDMHDEASRHAMVLAALAQRRRFLFRSVALALLCAPANVAAGGTPASEQTGGANLARSRLVRVGPKRSIPSVAEAARVAVDGDVVEIDAGTYVDDVAVWRQQNLTIRGSGGRVRMVSQGRSAEGKAIFVLKGDNVEVQGIEFAGMRVPNRNGAGIRHEGGKVLIRDCLFERNEIGVMTSNDPRAELVVDACELRDNAILREYRRGDDVGHQIYVGRIRRFTMRNSYVHRGLLGHLVKSRARENHIVCNRLTDERTGRSSYELEFPEGGIAYVIGNLIAQSPLTENEAMIAFGAEGYASSVNELYVVHNSLVDELPRGGEFLRVRDGGNVRLVALNNVLVGSGRFDAELGVGSGNFRVRSSEVADAAAYDLRLRPGTTVPGPSVDPGNAHGVSLRPACEYRHPRHSVALDVAPLRPGAFQSSAP